MLVKLNVTRAKCRRESLADESSDRCRVAVRLSLVALLFLENALSCSVSGSRIGYLLNTTGGIRQYKLISSRDLYRIIAQVDDALASMRKLMRPRSPVRAQQSVCRGYETLHTVKSAGCLTKLFQYNDHTALAGTTFDN
jgi:hypothetical protein